MWPTVQTGHHLALKPTRTLCLDKSRKVPHSKDKERVDFFTKTDDWLFFELWMGTSSSTLCLDRNLLQYGPIRTVVLTHHQLRVWPQYYWREIFNWELSPNQSTWSCQPEFCRRSNCSIQLAVLSIHSEIVGLSILDWLVGARSVSQLLCNHEAKQCPTTYAAVPFRSKCQASKKAIIAWLPTQMHDCNWQSSY